MKKAKPDSSVKKKPKNPALKLKKKKKIPTVAEGTSKIAKKGKINRKSRWEETAKAIEIQELNKTESPALAIKVEKEDVRESSRIKSLLEDKKKTVEQLFIAVSGKTLDDIIPDYLRKRPMNELKKLCLMELEKMSNDEIMDVISGKENPLFKEQETQTDFNTNSKDIARSEVEDINAEREYEQSENIEIEINDAQNQVPPEVLDEVSKDLGIPESDAELLELEMRARAIRSLLKLKSNEELSLDLTDE